MTARDQGDGGESGATRRNVLKLGGLAAVGGAAVSTLAAPAAAAAATRQAVVGRTKQSFVLANRFSVEIDGVVVKGVHTVSPIVSRLDRSASPPVKLNAITITKDFTATSEFVKWHQTTLAGKVDRRSISVIFHNDAGEEAGRLNFFDCLPTAWTGPAFNARSSAHATESIELFFDTYEDKG